MAEQANVIHETELPELRVSTVISGLQTPWSMAELPSGEFLVTERAGQLKLVRGDKAESITGVPEVYFAGQGGLLDIKLHPNYQNNGWLYLSYAFGKRSKNALKLMRAKLRDNRLVEQQQLLTVTPFKDTPVHYAGRITFLPDNSLLLTSGDGFDYRESAQKKDSLLGKIIRINDDGTTPEDNPFVAEKNTISIIYSLGHRNPQGLVYDSKRNVVFSNEHGPAGGDEINIIEAGKNYGWPVITYGRDYSGAQITPFREYPGMEQPLVNWTPSIAPSSMTVYYGEMFPEFQGDLLNTTLKTRELRWVDLDGTKPVKQVSLLKNLNQRFRHIEVAQDGSLLLLTDSGQLLRVDKP
ncbi:glucose dehydrogenase [Endozoicomonas sp. OPT23]|uniref:PQQ-dependent sugar dehydrogenase n=1 Tax=Endozoicomonas sp. OPT23 TaxID=2072845 RepID=UPI00129A70B0|nr:PQQ-dependent sugar dehydrogenase [Endozoicomonas sp. OPT23]MRI34225.1 glucose dehydrogenase [Endozoicomonas sp. OPT23]